MAQVVLRAVEQVGKPAAVRLSDDDVTLRQEGLNGDAVWIESLGRRCLLKLPPVPVIRSGVSYRSDGTICGAPIGRVAVQIDDGAWPRTARPCTARSVCLTVLVANVGGGYTR